MLSPSDADGGNRGSRAGQVGDARSAGLERQRVHAHRAPSRAARAGAVRAPSGDASRLPTWFGPRAREISGVVENNPHRRERHCGPIIPSRCQPGVNSSLLRCGSCAGRKLYKMPAPGLPGLSPWSPAAARQLSRLAGVRLAHERPLPLVSLLCCSARHISSVSFTLSHESHAISQRPARMARGPSLKDGSERPRCHHASPPSSARAVV